MFKKKAPPISLSCGVVNIEWACRLVLPANLPQTNPAGCRRGASAPTCFLSLSVCESHCTTAAKWEEKKSSPGMQLQITAMLISMQIRSLMLLSSQRPATYEMKGVAARPRSTDAELNWKCGCKVPGWTLIVQWKKITKIHVILKKMFT